MRHACLDQYRERFSPGIHRLLCQSSQQIDVEIYDSSSAQSAQILKHLRPGVKPPAQRSFPIRKRLHTEAHAIYARHGHARKCLIGELSGSALDSYFCVRIHLKLAANSRENSSEELRREQ